MTDIIQISNITFYYNRHSILTHDHLKTIGCLIVQLLLSDDTWSTVSTIAKNDQHNITSTEWTLIKIDFTQVNCGI